MNDFPIPFVLLGAIVTFASTAIGAIPALGTQTLTDNWKGGLIGFSAGVMLSASAFTLIGPSFEVALDRGNPVFNSAVFVSLSILLGALLIGLLNRFIPHEHFSTGREGGTTLVSFRRVWLFVIAITLHNFPEGLAVGSGVASQETSIALPILIGIGIQNLPEGFIVAFSLLGIGYSLSQSLMVALLTGLIEALSAILGFFTFVQISSLVPYALAMAGGAMISVVSSEMIPESHSKSQSQSSTLGLMVGFVLMFLISACF